MQKMNEFTAKKLGEVLSFATVGLEIVEKGYDPLLEVLGNDVLSEYTANIKAYANTIKLLAEEGGVLDKTEAKAKATGEKLHAMSEIYVKGQWDNATELLEWHGFFIGAALVHWALVKGVGQNTENDELIAMAEDASVLYYTFLEKIESELETIGGDKSNNN